MPPFALIALLFFAIPLIELTLLIRVGGVIGVGWTLGLVILTAVIGAWLLRIQGFATLRRARTTLDQGGIPALELLEGVALLVAGALLLTPGFVTDALGFALLFPPLRRSALAGIARRMVVQAGAGGSTEPGGTAGSASPQQRPRQGQTIDGEYTRDD